MVNNLLAGALVVVVALAGLLGWRLHSLQLEHQKYVAQVAERETRRAEVARAAEQENRTKESTHAAASQDNLLSFIESARTRADSAAADVARLDRLRSDAEGRASYYAALSSACSTSRGALLDRLERYDAQLEDGGRVVAQLRADLERRNDEVKLLQGQIAADRALLASP